MSQHATGEAKPMPRMEGLTREFYTWCKQGELRFQRCRDCGAWRHVPREMCGACGSWRWEWARSSGRGRVFTWTVMARPLHPAFLRDVPCASVVVEMDEGVRVVSQVLDCPAQELEIGLPVEVVFQDVTPEIALPKFQRVGT